MSPAYILAVARAAVQLELLDKTQPVHLSKYPFDNIQLFLCLSEYQYVAMLPLAINKNKCTSAPTVPQLPAHNSGIIVIPRIITHCSPCFINADLHPACAVQRSINQTHSSISATLCSYGKEYIYIYIYIYLYT